MEKFALPKFQHGAENLTSSLGLTQKEEHFIKNAIIFECLVCPILVTELYNSPEEAPDSLRTMTGIIERINEHLSTGEQQCFMLIAFAEACYTIRNEAASYQKAIEEKEDIKLPPKNFSKLVSKMVGKKVDSIIDSLAIIQECNLDFDKYIEKVMPEEDYDMSGNFVTDNEIDATSVADMLKDMFEEAIKAKLKAEKEEEEAKKKKDQEDNPE